jgi:peptidoglycan/xylan/chitin deacetylase (PgdA/CDA1 family)
MTALLTTSWDDGHPLDSRVAELLGEFGLAGTFYVPRAARSGTMSAAQLRDLAAHFEIGGHTLDHCFLTSASDDEASRQIIGAKSWIEDTTGKPCTMFCPPAGKYAARHVEMIRRAGYLGLRSVELLSTEPPRCRDGLMVMGTTLQAYPHSRFAYLKNTLKRGAWGNLARYASRGCPFDWECLAEDFAHEVLASGGVFHVWGHSWEIERTGQWAQLRRVMKRLAEVFEPRLRQTNTQVCQLAQLQPDSPVMTATGRA